MMTIIFLTNNYMPTPFANGVCIHALAKECVRRGYNTHVICTDGWKTTRCDTLQGINVHKIQVPFYNFFLNYYDQHKSSLVGKVFYGIGRFAALSRKLIHLNEYPLKDGSLVRRYVNEGKKILSNNNDTVFLIASYTPFEGIKAGARLLKLYPQVQSVYYSLDTLSNESGFGVLPESIRTRMGINQELKYFGLYKKVVLMNCHHSHYMDSVFDLHRDKYNFADFPLFQPSSNLEHKESLKIVYTGSLPRNIRNPRPAIQLLSQLFDEYSVHFYGKSDYDDILNEYSIRYPGHVVIHGLVPHEEAQQAVFEADIVLSIGNTHTEMAPSKIYEYMSSGKPIIHTYAEVTDPCLPVLEKYGNALLVDISNIGNSDIRSFVRNKKILANNELILKFKEATPSYTIDLFTEQQ